jgi:hypothetical protein
MFCMNLFGLLALTACHMFCSTYHMSHVMWDVTCDFFMQHLPPAGPLASYHVTSSLEKILVIIEQQWIYNYCSSHCYVMAATFYQPAHILALFRYV